MKKTILVLGLVLLIILGNTAVSLADAMSFDVEPAGYYVYVATPDGGLNMRYGPSVDYAKVMEGRIPDGVKLYIVSKSGNWGFTSYNGYEGWVALKQTTTTPPAPVSTPVPTPPPTATPQISQTPATDIAPTAEIPQTTPDAENEQTARAALTNQIVLVAIFVLFVIIASLLIVILINIKSRKQ